MTRFTPVREHPETQIGDRVTARLRAVLQDIGALAGSAGVAAYAVGGCVRDWLLRRPVGEVDIMVEGDSIRLARQWAQAHHGRITEHPQFRTATVECRAARSTQRIDFAACRTETYSEPAAYPRVSPGTLQEDLFRRDFTINAMAMRIASTAFGQLIDRYRGLDDLHARLIRVLHAESFRDDPSRVLRAIRFAERLHFTVEPQTAAWMRTALRDGWLSRLNRGRLRKELLAMLREPEPLACLRSLGQWLLGAQVS